MKNVILTLAMLGFSVNVMATPSNPSPAVPSPTMPSPTVPSPTVPSDNNPDPSVNVLADLTWLNIGYVGGPNVEGAVAVSANGQFAGYNSQTAFAHTDGVDTVENSGLFVKGAKEQDPDFVAGSVKTTATNSINTADLSATATNTRGNALAGSLNGQFATKARQYAHAGTEGGEEHSYMPYGHATVPTIAGDIDTIALNNVNFAVLNADANATKGDALTLAGNLQVAGSHSHRGPSIRQAAVAHTNDVESYGNITTLAGNQVNAALISVKANADNYATGGALNLQKAVNIGQYSSARTSDAVLHGGNVLTTATNFVNTVDMTVGANGLNGALAVGLSVQKAYGIYQEANALTNGVGTWGGSIATSASNGINTSSVNTSATAGPSGVTQ